MNKWLSMVCVVGGLAVGMASNVVAAGLKIGFVDTARVLKEAPQAEAARKRLERDFAPREKKIVAMQKTLRDLEDRMAKSGSFLTDDRRQAMQRKIKTQEREIKRAKEEFNEDLNLRRNDELHRLQKLIYDAIVALAKDEKFDAILAETIYASDRVDVTDRVLQRLRREFKKDRTAAGNPTR